MAAAIRIAAPIVRSGYRAGHFTRIGTFDLLGRRISLRSVNWGFSLCARRAARNTDGRSRVVWMRSHGGEGGMELMEGDVVEYPFKSAGVDGERTGVGVVVEMSKNKSDITFCHIEPLCQEDQGSKEWIHDEFQPEITVPVGQVRVLQAWYSQRMVPDRISNPHGEHAESLWIIE